MARVGTAVCARRERTSGDRRRYPRAAVTRLAEGLSQLVVQLRSKSYNPFFSWTVILSTSMAGTTMSDFMNRDASAKYLAAGAESLGWARRAWVWVPDRRSDPHLAARLLVRVRAHPAARRHRR
jgi:hypothetical protein